MYISMKTVIEKYGDVTRYVNAAKLEETHSKILTSPEYIQKTGADNIEQALRSEVKGHSTLALSLDQIADSAGFRIMSATSSGVQVFDPQLIILKGFWNPNTVTAQQRTQRTRLLGAADKLQHTVQSLSKMGENYNIHHFVEGPPCVKGVVYIPSGQDLKRIQKSGRDPTQIAMMCDQQHISQRDIESHRGLDLAKRLAERHHVNIMPGIDPTAVYQQLGEIGTAWKKALELEQKSKTHPLTSIDERIKKTVNRVLDHAVRKSVPQLFRQEVNMYESLRDHLVRSADFRPVAVLYCDNYHDTSQAIQAFATKDGISTVTLAPKLYR